MKKNMLLVVCTILVVPAIMILVFMMTGSKSNTADTKEGQSFLIAQENGDASSIEAEIRKAAAETKESKTDNTETATEKETGSETVNPDKEPTTPVPTEPETKPTEPATKPTEPETKPTEPATKPTEPATPAPTEPVTVAPINPGTITPAPGISQEGFYFSALGSYNPYSFDASKAQARLNAILSGSISYREAFATSAFVGDSVMDGFNCYMNFDYTFTEVGASMESHFPKVLNSVVSCYPEYVFVRYGLNEMDTTEAAATNFANNFKKYVATLKASLPNTRIIVIGLTPVGPAAINKNVRFGNVAMYNAKIKTFCIELGVAYYENSYLFLQYTNLYSKDGIHLQKTMYEIWLRDMITEMGIY